MIALPSVAPFLSTTSFRVQSALLIAAVLATPNLALAEDASPLFGYLPDDANAVAVVRVADILKSPRAVKEGWAEAVDEKFLSGAGGVPSWVETLAVSFLVRPATSEEVWAAAVAQVPASHSIQAIAARDHLAVETFAGLSAVRGRRDTFLLGIGDGLLGIRRPAERQEVVSWANAIRRQRTGISSDYLAAAAKNPAQIVMAIDLEHTFDPAMIRMHVQEDFPNLQNADQFVALLAAIQGVTLGVSINDESTVAVRMDFTQPVPSALAGSVKGFFLNVLHQSGLGIDELQDAAATAQGNAVLLNGPLSDESLRRIISLITTAPSTSGPIQTPPEPGVAATAPTGPRSVNAADSRTYLNAVNRILSDLERANRRATNYDRTAGWHENFARRIDDLPVEGVDPDLVNYGASVASKLRALARSLRGQAIAVNVQQQTLTYDMDFTPGWASMNVWGGIGVGQSAVNVRSNLQQVRERQAAAIQAGAEQRSQIWQMISDEQAAIQRTMRARFGADF